VRLCPRGKAVNAGPWMSMTDPIGCVRMPTRIGTPHKVASLPNIARVWGRAPSVQPKCSAKPNGAKILLNGRIMPLTLSKFFALI